MKYFTPACLQILNDIAKWSIGKKPDTAESIKRRRIKRTIFLLLVLFSLFSFISGGYMAKSSLLFTLSFIFAIIFAAWFVGKMKTKHLIAVSLSAILIYYVVERYAVLAGMWSYFDGAAPPLFALFAIPIFIIVILGLSYFLKRAFGYVNLSGAKFRNVPFALMLLAFVAFLQLEGYQAIATKQVIGIYAAFAILSLFYNNRQTLDWNLAFAVVALVLGGVMELLGASSGLWSYAFGERLPIFISFAWTLNAWAACGLAQIFRLNLKDAVVE